MFFYNLRRQVAAVRRRFKKLGPAVSPRVLDVVRSSISNSTDVAEALLRDIDNDSDRSETDITSAGIVFGDNRDGDGAAQFQVISSLHVSLGSYGKASAWGSNTCASPF